MVDEVEKCPATKAKIVASAAIGSAAIAAAVLFVKHHKLHAREKPPHRREVPETD